MSEQNSNVNASDYDQEISAMNAAVENTKKFLTFMSDGLIFGIDASYVIEIIINHNITFLPIVPYYIKGIINLRGQIVPIVDIRLRMGRPPMKDEKAASCIIIIEIDSVTFGIYVDAVRQMIDLDTRKISPPTVNNCEELVNGIVTLADGQTMLVLDNEALARA